jgi:hypothetical protein
MSDHPNPGNRVKSIEEQLPYMARGPFNASEGSLAQMQSFVDKLPPAPKKAAAKGQGSAPTALPNAQRPGNVQASTNFKNYQGQGFTVGYPSDWEMTSDQGSVTFAPKEGRVQTFIGYGAIISAAKPPSGKVNLAQDTDALLKGMAQQNANMRVEGQAISTTIGGAAALVSRLSSDSPYAGTRETDVVVTIDRGTTLFYIIFIAPEPDYARFEPVFQQMTRVIQFQ